MKTELFRWEFKGVEFVHCFGFNVSWFIDFIIFIVVVFCAVSHLEIPIKVGNK